MMRKGAFCAKRRLQNARLFAAAPSTRRFASHEAPLRHRRIDISETMRTDLGCEACDYLGRKVRSTALISRSKMV